MPVHFNELPDALVERIMDEYKYGLRFRMCMRECTDKYFLCYCVQNGKTRSVRPSDVKLDVLDKKMQELDRHNPMRSILLHNYNVTVRYAHTCDAYYA